MVGAAQGNEDHHFVWIMSAPKWPDFSLEPIADPCNGLRTWAARTDTGRPITPVFALWVSIPVDSTDEQAREIAREELWRRFRAAHPSGCPGGDAV